MKHPFLLLCLFLLVTACDSERKPSLSGQALLDMLTAETPKVEGVEQALLESAKDAENKKDYARSLQFYKQLADKSPEDPVYKVGIADNLRRLQKNDEALKQYDKVLEKDPNNIEALEGKGLVLLSKTDFQNASLVLEKVMSIDPKRWRTLNAVAILFVAKNMPKESFAYYEEALKVNPDEPAVLNNVGLTMGLVKDYDRAILALTRASQKLKEKDPQKRQVDLNLALIYGLTGQMEIAEQMAKPHLSEAALNNNLGFYAYLADNESLAKAYLNQAISGSSTFYQKAWDNLEILGGNDTRDNSRTGFGSSVTAPVVTPTVTPPPPSAPPVSTVIRQPLPASASVQAQPQPPQPLPVVKPVKLQPIPFAVKPKPVVVRDKPTAAPVSSVGSTATFVEEPPAPEVPMPPLPSSTLSDNTITLPELEEETPPATLTEDTDIAPAVVAPVVDISAGAEAAPEAPSPEMSVTPSVPATPKEKGAENTSTPSNLSDSDKSFLDSFGKELWNE